MIYKDNDLMNFRQLSGLCESEFCVVVSLNHLVFDLLIREKLKKEREALALFIFKKCIAFGDFYSYNKILSNVNYIFQQKSISKGESLCVEG